MRNIHNYAACLFVGFAVKYVFGLNSKQLFVKMDIGINSCLGAYLISSESDHTAVSCGMSCNQEAICKSYIFTTDTPTCSLYSEYLTGNATPEITKLYYIRNDAVEKKVPSTCKDVQKVGHTTDGEYWLYPKAWSTDLGRIKIYCHGLGTETPSEFVSLIPGTNVMYEGGASNENVPGVSFVFNKVKVNINTMVIDTSSLTFANPSTHSITYTFIGYGTAASCWHSPFMPGTATMDTVGTGLIINPTLSWHALHGAMWSFTRDDTKIFVSCVGGCGICEPSGEMSLLLNPSEVLNVNEAILLCE